jgi:micrococcal nuclease
VIRRALLAVVVVLVLAGCPPAPAPAPGHRSGPAGPAGPGETGTRLVVRVVDGDTVVLNGGERVRLAQVNTPEIDEEYGPEARDFARTFALDRRARIQGSKRDHYGRTVADVIVEGKSLAVELAARGLAHLYLIPPVDREQARRLLAAQQEARAARLGIWATSRYQGQFHITSFHANPRGNDNFNLNGEYVRVACVGTRPQSLKGYALSNRRGERYTFGDVVVPPGHTVMVHSGHGGDQIDPARQQKLFWRRSVGAWTNRGDTATLLDPQGQVVDQVVYDPHHRKQY